MTDSEQTGEKTSESEWAAPDIKPREGETYYQAYERMLKEEAGIVDEPQETESVLTRTDMPESEVLGVLTGQVPVKSAPIAMDKTDPTFGGQFDEEDETSE